MTRLKGATLTAGALAPFGIAALAMLGSPPATPQVPSYVNAPAPTPTPSATAKSAAAPSAIATVVTGNVSATPTILSDMVPADCLKRFAVDLPVQRGDDVATHQTIICRRGYVLSFDAGSRDPDWVMEHLTPADLAGSARRTNKFTHDVLVPVGADASNADYLKSGFDRGHQAPAGDAKFDQKIMDQSFYFTNMAPQIGIGFNRGVWKFLEETTRAWVMCGGHPDLYVITGPIYDNKKAGATIGADKVLVPVQFFKIVYDPAINRAVGFVLPNVKIGSRVPDLQVYVKPIAWIETETGLNFFRTMSFRQQNALKTEAGTAWGHVASCPGDATE